MAPVLLEDRFDLSANARGLVLAAPALSSTAAALPLKSKRVPISLVALSTAFFTSTKSASQTVSKEGMVLFLSVSEQ